MKSIYLKSIRLTAVAPLTVLKTRETTLHTAPDTGLFLTLSAISPMSFTLASLA
ncbi:hypothetical protein EBME_2029 [bacterium endosymbiont of Mortierella elongata FMR23-6]|nr:hypothetical protein EBME_2029 [bacterium endosymbiont of Mortierella elongata FMR23-6]